jgi:hypothetical protein
MTDNVPELHDFRLRTCQERSQLTTNELILTGSATFYHIQAPMRMYKILQALGFDSRDEAADFATSEGAAVNLAEGCLETRPVPSLSLASVSKQNAMLPCKGEQRQKGKRKKNKEG